MENKAPSSEKEEESCQCFVCNQDVCMRANRGMTLISTREVMRMNSKDLVEVCRYSKLAVDKEINREIDEITDKTHDSTLDKPLDRIANSTQHIIENNRPLRRPEIIPNSPGVKRPFKSPVELSSTVNLKIRTKGELIVKNESSGLENIFIDDEEAGVGRQKRKSSVVAEAKIKKQIIEEANSIDKEDCFVKSAFESMFWGISKPKKAITRPDSNSAISGIFSTTAQKLESRQTTPEHKGVLQDVTNSPSKQAMLNHKKDQPLLNTKFFLDQDISIENGENEESVEGIDKGISSLEEMGISSLEEMGSDFSLLVPGTDILQYLPGRKYHKEREANTKLNEGYTIVETKKKAVVELFSCQKTFFRKSTRERLVYFTVNPKSAIHNAGGDLKPITAEALEPSFKWEGEKEVVEIVRRIELGVETTPDDFVFRKVNKGIEL